MKAMQAAIDDAKSIVRTPWLARTQWLERYVGVDMVKLAEMTERPRNEEWMLNVWDDVGSTFIARRSPGDFGHGNFLKPQGILY